MYESSKKKYTVKDYEQLPEGSPYQLINGDLIMSPSPNSYHQKILLKLTLAFSEYLTLHNKGEILFSPIDVVFSESNVLQPDLVFISNENKSIIRDRIEGTPDLILEVLSESNAYYDLKQKKKIYEESCVKEYWIVDPIEKSIEIYENEKNEFILISKTEAQNSVHSKLLQGLQINPEDIF